MVLLTAEALQKRYDLAQATALHTELFLNLLINIHHLLLQTQQPRLSAGAVVK
jgi:hypothetical protein